MHGLQREEVLFYLILCPVGLTHSRGSTSGLLNDGLISEYWKQGEQKYGRYLTHGPQRQSGSGLGECYSGPLQAEGGGFCYSQVTFSGK